MTSNDDAAVIDLLRTVLGYEDQLLGGGSMTCAIYDTAWVSMIRKETAAGSFWLFPESFTYVCSRQEIDGGWNRHGQQADRIIDSAAALLAICKHLDIGRLADPETSKVLIDDLANRAKSADRFLHLALKQWTIDHCDNVEFEVIIPSLLNQLCGFGHDFDFPDKEGLIKLRDKKLERFDVRMLGNAACPQISMIHSLEALIPEIEFDEIRHLKRLGSYLGSPSATAASLVFGKQWDLESETYLRQVLIDGEGRGSGGAPSAFPSQWFELSWIVTTLTGCGYDIPSLAPGVASRILHMLQKALREGSGVVGFAPTLVADADDTAKMILAVRSLGGQASTQGLIATFEEKDHFKTYSSERTMSLTTNCNVLLTLLSQHDEIEAVRPAMEKVVDFLCQRWFQGPVGLSDKWNTSKYYPKMLMARSLTSLLTLNTRLPLRAKMAEARIDRVNLVVHQILVSTLREQSSDGSWERSVEPTCYAIIALGSICELSLARDLVHQIEVGLVRAERYLENASTTHLPDRIWVEKVTYGSLNLSKAYQVGARKILMSNLGLKRDKTILTSDDDSVCGFDASSLHIAYRSLPVLKDIPEWLFMASLNECRLATPLLRQQLMSVFPEGQGNSGKHLGFVPLTWIITWYQISPQPHFEVQLDMMVYSAAMYTVDRHIERNIGRQGAGTLSLLRAEINQYFANTGLKSRAHEHHISDEVLRNFISWVHMHPAVQRATTRDRNEISRALVSYLLAQLDTIEDSTALKEMTSTQNGKSSPDRYKSLHQWIDDVAGLNAGGMLATWFLICLSTKTGPACVSEEGYYLVASLTRHINALTRLHNDYGSAERDAAEHSLNSLNFFDGHNGDYLNRARLLRLAELEEAKIDKTMDFLTTGVIAADTMQALRILVATVKMYGQMYVLKDHTEA